MDIEGIKNRLKEINDTLEEMDMNLKEMNAIAITLIAEMRGFKRRYTILWLLMFGGFLISFTAYWIVRYGLK